MLFLCRRTGRRRRGGIGQRSCFPYQSALPGEGQEESGTGIFRHKKSPSPEGEDFFPEAVSYRVSALSKCSFRTLMDSLN